MKDKGVFAAGRWTYTHTHIKTRASIDALWKRRQPSSFSSTHFKPQPASLSALKSQLSWCLEVGTKWMKFICLESFVWVSHTFFHMQTVCVCVCVCAGVGVLCIHHHIYYMCTLCVHTSLPVIVSITSHTINSLLHYNEWMRNAKEKHSTGKHTWNIKCSQKNCDDMLHFRNRAFTSKPFFFNFVTYFSFHFILSTSFHSSSFLHFISRCIFVCVCFCLDSVVYVVFIFDSILHLLWLPWFL